MRRIRYLKEKIMRTQVIIDADFLNIFLSFKDGEILFKDIMESLGFSPVIHQYVADNELDVNQKAKQLIDENIIERIPYDKIFNHLYTIFYQIEFEEYYKEMNKKMWESDKTDIFHYRKARENLGEIHSCIMAHFLGLKYFMSNDGGAKELVIRRVNNNKFQLTVLSFENFLNLLVENKKKLSIDIKKRIIEKLLKVENNNGYIISKKDAKLIKKQLQEL